MALSDKQITKALAERVGEHVLRKVEFEVWCLPGCELAMVADINKALNKSIFVSDWGSPTVLDGHGDDDSFPVVP